MKVLFLAAEATPFAKVGGLADVAGELPGAMAKLGVDIRLCLPMHQTIDRTAFQLEQVAQVQVPYQDDFQEATLFETEVRGVKTWLIDGDPVREVPGVYGEMALDADKFTFVNLAALAFCEQMKWIPDILHANDWHAAAAVMMLKEEKGTQSKWSKTRSLYTLHNLPYMGVGAEEALDAYGLNPKPSDLLPDWAVHVPLAQGVLQADWVSTVSPTYAKEIQTAAFGAGLESLLESRSGTLSGILNGIDPAVWDPAQDPALEFSFDDENLLERGKDKAALQSELDLPLEPGAPIMGVISRIDTQKGMDLIWPALEELGADYWQLVLLGTGDPKIEAVASAFEASHPERVRIILRFDANLARRIYAGTDMLLIPSRYEPCGLAQLIAMRYGCIPIVRATGGLVDTVIDVEQEKEGTGFVFGDASPEALRGALERAFKLFEDQDKWSKVQRTAMQQDFSWTQSAHEYQKLYQQIEDLDAA
jgi:starch synthase